MIQSIYTSVNDANIVPCGKKPLIPSTPIPLIKSKYLGEFRTELERAKARKNLGIPDDTSYTWGNIEGHIEDQKDLVQYIEQKWHYTSDVAENINSVKEALDYALYFISQYDANTEEIQEINKQIEQIKQSIADTEESLQQQITSNSDSIKLINQSLTNINQQISDLNDAIINIDVDKNILKWMQGSTGDSDSISLEDETTLEVLISSKENNALTKLSDGYKGLYVPDLNPKVTELEQGLNTTNQTVESVQQETSNNTSSIEQINTTLEVIDTYQTELPESTQSPEDVGGISQGTTVQSLKGKTISQILDELIFPTITRDLVYPRLYYNFTSRIVEINTQSLSPTLTFEKNDAGNETSRKETVLFNGSEVEDFTSYNQIGTYTHKGTVSYDAGEYLVDNKGEVSEKRVEAGSLTATAEVISTYPWYAGNTSNIYKQELIPFNKSSEVTISLTGNAVIKLPGKNTQLTSFKVDGGLGYLDVNLDGWETSTEEINSYTYKVWSKKDSYSALLSHKINFILKE